MARTSSEALGEPVEGHGASDVACREGGAAGAIGPAGTSVAARIRALPWVCTRARASHVRVLEIFVCVSLSPPTSPVAVWVGQMGVHACMDGSRKHACLHAPTHYFDVHYSMLIGPGAARRCIASFNGRILFMPSSYRRDEAAKQKSFPPRGRSPWEPAALTLATYYLLVVGSLTGLCARLHAFIVAYGCGCGHRHDWLHLFIHSCLSLHHTVYSCRHFQSMSVFGSDC